ncbi:hypothetical protein O181_079104 [Austropuccinia psidii MF-1]|uniref:Uncharacterized protein n=1 Tax=Austropuccinia psidii MF-1 TaxID=1389203 RepID=A0A9Q3FI83_9BASI|nr:hypothetical protein [Austropuccinia psidii MF-1]
MLTTLAIFFAITKIHIHIIPAINNLMATNPNVKVFPEDFLKMICQISTSFPNFDHSNEIARVYSSSRFGLRQSFKKNVTQQTFSQNQSGNVNSEASSIKNSTTTPNSKYPCHYCGEIGNWSTDFLTQIKANLMRNRTRGSGVNVASIGILPSLEDTEGLLDSGATHSIVVSFSLFTSMASADMTLSVASCESYRVDGIVDIELDTPVGISQPSGVLILKEYSWCSSVCWSSYRTKF